MIQKVKMLAVSQRTSLIVSFLLLWTTLTLMARVSDVTIEHLKCNFRENPLGIETNQPSFSWQLKSSERNQTQTAYRILVADNEADLSKNIGNHWDSGKVLSSQSVQVEGIFKTLKPAQKYYWKVMVWDAKGVATAWSPLAFWQMGLLNASDWSGAEWIALEKIAEVDKILPALHAVKAPQQPKWLLPQFRKELVVAKKNKTGNGICSGFRPF